MDQKHGKTYTIDLEHKETPVAGFEKEDDDKVEQVLYLLDKFCASDELYHELTIMSDELPKSYLILSRNETNSMTFAQLKVFLGIIQVLKYH